MKWTKNKIAADCYSFFAKDKKTKFDFSITYAAGDIELVAWYNLCDEPFYEFITKTPASYKVFLDSELQFFKDLLIENVAGKLRDCAGMIEESYKKGNKTK